MKMILSVLLFIAFFVMRRYTSRVFGAAETFRSVAAFVHKELLVLLFVATALLQLLGVGIVLIVPAWLYAISFLVAILGIYICFMTRVVRGQTWKRFGTKPAKNTLTTCGPYRYSRHPYYLGVTLWGWGVSVVFGNVTMLLIALVWQVASVYAARREESLCEREFGKQWRTYKQKTPFWFGRPKAS